MHFEDPSYSLDMYGIRQQQPSLIFSGKLAKFLLAQKQFFFLVVVFVMEQMSACPSASESLHVKESAGSH